MAYGWIKRKNEIVWETIDGRFNTVEAAVDCVMRRYNERRTVFLTGTSAYPNDPPCLACDTEPTIGWTQPLQIIGKFAPDEAREILLTYARML